MLANQYLANGTVYSDMHKDLATAVIVSNEGMKDDVVNSYTRLITCWVSRPIET